MIIKSLVESDSINVRKQLIDIFFETSSIKEFKDESEKNNFHQRWQGNYLDFMPNEFFVAYDENDNVIGYLCGHSDSQKALQDFQNPSTELFEKHFKQFPAHLHINFTERARGQGLGKKLIDHYVTYLKRINIKGLHIVTTKDARNVSFYQKNGFDFYDTAQFKAHTLMFMGRTI